ncbi:MAG: hypothetical protein JRH11_14190 [Deltaproteobacteria bacterium]|nr:hypothetical protein [Deltaproteobacteria bacterium]
MNRVHKRSREHLRWALLAVCLMSSFWAPSAASAQHSPHLRRGEEQEPYPHILPFFGSRVAKKGFSLPLPLGANLVYIGMVQPISIDRIRLRANGGEWVDVSDLLTFDAVDSTVNAVTARFDMWLFPFLNLWGMVGGGASNTTVTLAEPIQLTSSPTQSAFTWGVGITAAFGFEHFFITADFNLSWTDLELLETPVMANILSARVGRNFVFENGMQLGLWLGAMRQGFDADTSGEINIQDAVEGGAPSGLDGLAMELMDACNAGDSQACRRSGLVGQIQDGFAGRDTTIGYDLDKAPAQHWNMLIGAQWGINENLFLRTEVGVIERFSLMVNINYRFGLGLGG